VTKERSVAREFAFQFLFHLQLPIFEQIKKELLSSDDDHLLDKTYEELKQSIPNSPKTAHENFSIGLIKGTLKNYYSLSQMIDKYAENWKLERLPKVDLTILLLSTYELLNCEEKTPPEVVINEAIELAKKFGTKDSKSFVNALLDNVYKNEVNK
jgi:N utilization substance protein B